MNAGQIVRALAAIRAPVEIDVQPGHDFEYCLTCDVDFDEPQEGRSPYLRIVQPMRVHEPTHEGGFATIELEKTEDILEAHDLTCPWRMAKEWVAEHPT